MNAVQEFLRDKGYNTKSVTQSRKRFERLIEEYAIKYHKEQLNKLCVSNAFCDLNPDFQQYLIEQGETKCSSCGKKLKAK